MNDPFLLEKMQRRLDTLTEESLRQSEEKYRAILEDIEDGYYEADLKGTLTFFNESFRKIWGYPRDDLLGMDYRSYTDEENALKAYRTFNRVYTTGIPSKAYGWDIIRGDGTLRNIELSVALIRDGEGNRTGFRGIVRDVTDRKQTENELRNYRFHLEELVAERTAELMEANQRLQKEIDERRRAEKGLLKEKGFSEDAVNSLPGIFYLQDRAGRFFRWNKNLEDFSGYNTDDMKEIHVLDFFNEREKPRVAERIREVFEKGKSEVETSIVTKDGQEIPYLLTGLRSVIDQKVYLVGVGIDITQRKRAEEALRESEEKLAGILGSVTDVMIIVDESFQVLWSNDVARRLFEDCTEGKACYQALQGADDICEPCIGKKCFEDGKSHESEILRVGENSERLAFWCTASVASRHEDGRVRTVLEVCRNITEKKALEAEAMRAGHLAALGELAAGVAHEINNPINAIINYAQIQLDQNHLSVADKEIPKRVIKEGKRVALIVSKLLSFARESGKEATATTVREILEDALSLVGRQIQKDGIKLEIEVPETLPQVRVRSQEIQQVFLNLFSNARYALNMKYPGHSTEKRLEIQGKLVKGNRGRMVRITFYDQGTGISREIQEKICDPFFSTKPKGEGTGLGLSISYGIIKDHGGNLWFDSLKGQYTKVTVDLPVHVLPHTIQKG